MIRILIPSFLVLCAAMVSAAETPAPAAPADTPAACPAVDGCPQKGEGKGEGKRNGEGKGECKRNGEGKGAGKGQGCCGGQGPRDGSCQNGAAGNS